MQKHMHSQLWRIVAPPMIIALLAVTLVGFEQDGSSLMPVDEFGRNSFEMLTLAILFSLAKGIAITVAVALLASVLAYITARDERQWARLGLRAVCAVVESVPLVLWIVIIVVSVKGPRLGVTLIAFGVLVLPPITQVILGEFMRLRSTPFVEAAYLLGLSEARVFARYLLPAALPVLVPMLIQVFGSAIAIDGAIGVFGLGSRSDIDLGVFLLRGKEQFITRPGLLVSSLLAYGAIYFYLQWLAHGFGKAAHGTKRVVQ